MTESTLTPNLNPLTIYQSQYDLARESKHGHAAARRQASDAAIEAVKQRLYDLETVDLDPLAAEAVGRAIHELRQYQLHG